MYVIRMECVRWGETDATVLPKVFNIIDVMCPQAKVIHINWGLF